MEWIAFEPATAFLFWSSASNFLTTGEGGRFRWGNIWGNSAIILCSAFSNSLGHLDRKKEQSILGMAVGAMATVLPVIDVLRWKRMIPKPYSTAAGSACFGYYAYMYYQDTVAIENAGED